MAGLVDFEYGLRYRYFSMVEKIRQHLHVTPFVPFKIRTSDGRGHLIPTGDHAAVRPNGTRVIVFGDAERDIYLSSLHIVAVEEGASAVN